MALHGTGAGPSLARWADGEEPAERVRLPRGQRILRVRHGTARCVRPHRPRRAASALLGPGSGSRCWRGRSRRHLEDACAGRPRARSSASASTSSGISSAYAALLEEARRSPILPRGRSGSSSAPGSWGSTSASRVRRSSSRKGAARWRSVARACARSRSRSSSDGYRAMLSVVLDLAIRFAQLFSALDDPLAGEAIVGVDEVRLNLHPRWRRRIIDQLTGLFPRTRFVLTAHSPAVVRAAIDDRGRESQILVLDEKPGEGTTVRPLTKGDLERLDGAEVDSVMVDDAVFGVSSRLSPTCTRRWRRGPPRSGGRSRAARRRRATSRILLETLDRAARACSRGEEEREARGAPVRDRADADSAAQAAGCTAFREGEGGRR